jgi:hypothetical protein
MITGLVTAAVAPQAKARDDETRIEDVRLRLAENQVLISFRLAQVFDEELERRLESGLLTGFSFQIQLLRDRKSWFDTSVDSGRLRVDAMYNAVTREYLVNYRYDGKLIESRLVREPEELERAMTEFSDFPAFTLEGRAKTLRLQVRIRAILGTRTILFFIPRTQSTDWVESRKFQLEEPSE